MYSETEVIYSHSLSIPQVEFVWNMKNDSDIRNHRCRKLESVILYKEKFAVALPNKTKFCCGSAEQSP